MTKTVDAPNTLHEDYTPTKRAAYHSQREVAKAWREGKYPVHTGGELYSSDNFRGYLRNDGSGRLMHYRTREAIRTRRGLIINNSQCWATGFAHCTPAPNADAELPIGGIESVMESRDHVYEIWAVLGSGRRTGAVIAKDYGVAVGRDSSARGPGYFAVKVTKSELERMDEEGVQEVLEEILKPEEVRGSDMPVVDSSEYSKTRLSKKEVEAHRSHGGSVTKISRGRWRKDYIGNLQQYRADLRGRVIVRQGEYFFIPDYSFDPSEHPDARFSMYEKRDDGEGWRSRYRQRILGSHVPQRSEGIVTVDGGVWVQGSIRHEDGDHDAINLGDIWHKVVTHDREAVSIDTSPRGGSYAD